MSAVGLSKLAIALTIIFVISLAALFAELYYILRRRRASRGENLPSSNGEYSSSDSCFSTVIPSKNNLLYFCVRSQSRIEPNNSVTSNPSNDNDLSSNAPPEMEVIDVWKLQRMCGPSRFLFTIREEEKEDLESVAEKSLCSSVEKGNCDNRGRVTLKEFFEAVEESPKDSPVVNIHGGGGGGGDEVELDNGTPCDSPVYFTPLASPIHECSEVLSVRTEKCEEPAPLASR